MKSTKELIKQLLAIMEEEGLNQVKLAKKSKMKQPYISRVLKCITYPTILTFNKLLNSMGYKLQIVRKEK